MEKVHSGGSPKCMTTTRRLWHDSQECKLIFYKSAALRKRGKRTLAEASGVEAMSDMTTDWCTRASQHQPCNTSVYVHCTRLARKQTLYRDNGSTPQHKDQQKKQFRFAINKHTANQRQKQQYDSIQPIGSLQSCQHNSKTQ